MPAVPKKRAQAWVALRADDPEALSALRVARAHLPAGSTLVALRRFRVFELAGALPERARVEELLHRSTQFYNPHKERCELRMELTDPAPAAASEHVVMVFERDGERRPAAERWWRHETGARVDVREGTAYVLRFEPTEDSSERAADLARLRDRRHGLFGNPNSQECALATAEIPLRWIGAPKPRRRTRRA
jgi:hypothetical protein